MRLRLYLYCVYAKNMCVTSKHECEQWIISFFFGAIWFWNEKWRWLYGSSWKVHLVLTLIWRAFAHMGGRKQCLDVLKT